MTPSALRAAITYARLRPRMCGPSVLYVAAYLRGMIAGAAPDGAAADAAWLDAYAAVDPLHPTDAEVCDAAEATVAALWPQGDDAPVLYLDAIEARETAALAAVRERLRTESLDAVGVVSLKVAEQRAEDAVRLVAEVRCLRAAERHSAGHDALDDATVREVLDATRAVVTDGLGLAAVAPDVATLQLPEYVGNLLARMKRIEGERDAAEVEVRRLRAEVEAAEVDALKAQAAAAEVDALKAQAAAAEPVLMLDAIRRGACVPGLCAACDAPWVDDADHNCAACGNPEGERRWDAATNAVLAYIEREQTKRYGRGSQPIAVVRADGDYFTAIYRHTADGLREPWQTARFRTPADAARRLTSMLGVDLAVIDAAAEGEAFVDAHPYAAGAIMGGVAIAGRGEATK